MNEKVEATDQSLPVAKLLEIDKICRRFEAAWKAGQEPKVEDFLGNSLEPERSELRRELLAIEIEYRKALKDPLAPAAFHPAAPPPAKSNRESAPKLQAQVHQAEPGKAAPAGLGNIREYRLLEKLGEGGMGVVYKALHTKLDKLVALKVLPVRGTDDPERVARFEQEMKAVGRLEDPHLVRAMDAGQAGTRQYLVMEYVDGLNLSEVLAQAGQLRIADACEMVRQAALGLKAIDAHALVHRDIKPSNLMLNAEGQVKILDLGLALFATEKGLEEGAQVAGTPDYIAPEQVAGSGDLDIRADLYSLGCTLYKLLTGQAPFSGEKYPTSREKFWAHLQEQAPTVQSVRAEAPAKLAAIIDRLLAKDRDLRIPEPGQLAEALRPFCAGADLAGLAARLVAVGTPRQQADGSRAVVQSHVTPSPPSAQPSSPPSRPAEAEEAFDPYYKWLGIPPGEQPPNHYRLLGLQVLEADRDVIQSAVARQAAHLRTFALGAHARLSQRLLNEVHVAKICLLVPEKRAAYDRRLREQLAAVKTAVPKTVKADQPPGATATPGATGGLPTPGATGGLPTRAADRTDREIASGTQAGRRPLLLRRMEAVVSTTARWLAAAARKIARVPPWVWTATGGMAAMFVLGLIVYVVTDHGLVKIELLDPKANVEIKVDGDTIELAGLRDPIRLKAGQHELEVTSHEFQTCTKSFTIKRGEMEVVRVSLVPKAKPADTQASPHPSPLPKGEGSVPSPGATAGSSSSAKDDTGRKAASPFIAPDGNWNLPAGAPPPAVAPYDEQRAKEHQRAWAKHLSVPVELTNSLGMKLRLIPPGEFDMGSTPEEIAWTLEDGKPNKPMPAYSDVVRSEAPRHRVKISKPFYLAMYPVTQGEYEKVMGVNPSAFSVNSMDFSSFKPSLPEGHQGLREMFAKKVAGEDTSRHPVETVLWDDAIEFCRRLSVLPAERFARRTYRLPTEAEREFACRAGTTTRWWCGDDEVGLGECDWFDANSGGMTHPVGQKKPNAWGLYDMHGNVMQWCADWFSFSAYNSQQSPASDPMGPPAGSGRVVRGGSFYLIAPQSRSASRFNDRPDWREPALGFRVVVEVPPGATDDSSTRVAGDTAGEVSTDTQRAQPEPEAGFVSLFDGKTLDGWEGDKQHYRVEDGCLVSDFGSQGYSGEDGQLFTTRQYDNFILRFEYKLSAAANSGLLVRAPISAKSSREALEFQILDDSAPGLAKASPAFRNGALRSVLAPRHPSSKPLDQWIAVEMSWISRSIKIALQGVTIIDTDTANLDDKVPAGRAHPGLRRQSGFIGFIGSRGRVDYRNMRIKELASTARDGNWNLPAGAPPPASAPFDEQKAKEHQQVWAKHLGVPVETSNSIGMQLVLIPPGDFMMGDETGPDGEKPVHKVRITKPFYLGKYEVTQEQWQAVMGNNPSGFTGPKNPVEKVSWDDCQVFVAKLNAKFGSRNGEFRLPTEAQWEYACRAGSTTTYCYGDDETRLGEYAWYHANSGGQTHPVGGKKPNAWGLYDMHGNVWEWCADGYDRGYYAGSPTDDPMAPTGGPDRMHCGGTWVKPAWGCRSAARIRNSPGRRHFTLGFRVSRVAAELPGGSSPGATGGSSTRPSSLDPKEAMKFCDRGWAYLRKGDLDDAIASYTEAIRLDPKYAPAYSGRGNAYLQKGDLDDAIASYTEAIRLDPKYAPAYSGRGFTYARKGETDMAIADCNEAVRLEPKLALAHYNRGYAYARKGDFDNAIANYTEAIAINPKFALAHHNRGIAYARKGESSKANEDFAKAKALGYKR